MSYSRVYSSPRSWILPRVPVIHKRVTCNSFQYLMAKLERKLSSWSSSMLSFVGRLTLAKSVLAATPTYFMQSNLLPIKAFAPCTSPTAGDDRCSWAASRNGLYSTKSAYKALMQHHWGRTQNLDWLVPWKTGVPERIRCFLWLSLRDKILSNVNRHTRHLTDDASYPLCTNIPWNKFFSSLAWQLWKRRNDFIFSGTTLSNSNLLSRSLHWARLYEDPNSSHDHPTCLPIEDCVWHAPPSSWIALYSDGVVSSSSSLGSAGGLLRDSFENWLGGFSVRSTMLKFTPSPNAHSIPLSPVRAFASLHDRAWFVDYKLIRRGANTAADTLTKFSLQQDAARSFLGLCPTFLQNVLLNDKSSNSRARGLKKHLKRLNAPRHWMLDKLGGAFAPKPSSGPHKSRECLPLILILRNRLKYALTYREVIAILMQRHVMVDGKVRTDKTYPAGFMDVVSIPKTNEDFRLLYDTKGRFRLHAITGDETKFKLCKVRSVQFGQKGIPYLNTYDGRTIRYPDPLIKANDTIKLDLESNKIVDFIKFDVGNVVMVTGGRNRGRVGVIKNREKHKGSFETIHVQDAAGHEFATRLGNVFTIGKGTKPWVSLPKGKGIKLSIIEEARKRLSAQAAA
ncbi:40S ribosomal protein S4 [Hibiscus syriacus]|uniref:40S ribosomal protein S4 n=1 Tax=Hibiscus syriacus TaxID=106335 RepID=A0A6A3BP03_HIBSY|nr:40S ribosomal protein S4 [Hibiscus syriacus]